MDKKILTKMISGAAMLLLLAACTQDELADGGNTLPEGKYPLEIASVTMDVTHSQQPWNVDVPQTRVSESDDRNSSMWDGGESIGVRIASNGNETAVYTLQSDKTTLQPADKPLYWKNTTASKVCAWFPADGKVDLSKQTSELAYALYAETTEAVNYNTTDIKLPFEHKLAKVKVVLTGEKKDGVTDVKINTFTSCTLNADGTLAAGGTQDYIPMVQTTYNGETYWEANVVPVPEDETTDYKITHIKINDKEITLTTPLAPLAAKVNTIELKVNKKVVQGGETITGPGDYIMKGNITESVTLNAEGINLTLDNVQANTNDAPLIIGENAQVELNVSGTANSLTSANGNGIEIREGASLSITGNGMNSSKLVVNASANTDPNTELRAGIGPSTGNVSIKTINISNVHLVVSGGRTGNNGNGPAAIGLCSVNGTYNQSCEGISITSSKIEATSYGGACIGTGSVSNDIYTGGSYNLGLIDIRNSEITATAQVNGWDECGSCIGFGYIGADASGVIQGIKITNTTLNLTVTNRDAYKVGRGNVINNASYSITNGIIVDGQNKGSEGWNP